MFFAVKTALVSVAGRLVLVRTYAPDTVRDHMPGQGAELRALMSRYQKGEMLAFEGLYAALAPPLARYLRSLTHDAARAEDLLQDTFLQIHRSRRSFDPRLAVEPWAYAIAWHVYLMSQRSLGRRLRLEAASAEAHEPHSPPHDAPFMAQRRLNQGLRQLTQERRDAVVLHHVWGLSFREIAERLRISDQAAKLRASRGIAALREILGAKRGP